MLESTIRLYGGRARAQLFPQQPKLKQTKLDFEEADDHQLNLRYSLPEFVYSSSKSNEFALRGARAFCGAALESVQPAVSLQAEWAWARRI